MKVSIVPVVEIVPIFDGKLLPILTLGFIVSGKSQRGVENELDIFCLLHKARCSEHGLYHRI